MSLKSTLRKLQRSFSSKDEKAFDEAVEELEDHVEDRRDHSRDEEDPDEITIHNHIPGNDGLGEMPAEETEGQLKARDDEEPEWFKKFSKDCMDRFGKMSNDIGSLQKWARQEEGEPEHQEDRRDGGLENLGEYAEHDDIDPNLEMDRRSRDDVEEMGENEKEWPLGKDRSRDRRDRKAKDDEPNKAILGELEFEAPPGTGDRARKARDSQYLEDSFQDVASKAEILAPGIRIPTFDQRAAPLKTARAIFGLRTTALDLAYNKPETRGLIDGALSGRALDTKRMSTGAVRVLFNAIANQVAGDNNRRATDRGGPTSFGRDTSRQASTGGIQSLGDINARNREKWRKSA